MSYKLSFSLDPLFIDVYLMKYVNDFPTDFQIFVNGWAEGFMSYEASGWALRSRSKYPGRLTEALAEEIGAYLIAYYS